MSMRARDIFSAGALEVPPAPAAGSNVRRHLPNILDGEGPPPGLHNRAPGRPRWREQEGLAAAAGPAAGQEQRHQHPARLAHVHGLRHRGGGRPAHPRVVVRGVRHPAGRGGRLHVPVHAAAAAAAGGAGARRDAGPPG
ncbi:hypothetical protein ACP70R_036332 [Stipagrostis hirtigluma subsp. patula]